MGAIKDVVVPDIGDFKDVPVIEVLVKPGDTVKAEDSLVTLESDKATMEVPAPVRRRGQGVEGQGRRQGVRGRVDPHAGGAAKARAAPHAKPAAGSGRSAAAPARRAIQPRPAPAPGAGTAPAPAPAPPQAAVDEAGFARAHASPAVRRFARELGVDLGKVKGTGPKERILKEDIQGFVKEALARPAAARGGGAGLGLALPAMPVVDFAKFGPVEAKPLSRIKKISGAFLHRNWVSIPHVTQHDEADITELEAFRKSMSDEAQKQGVRLTPLAFMMKAWSRR